MEPKDKTINAGEMTPQNSTSFSSLFLSLTRPIAPTITPYTILFQHTLKFPERLVAAEPESKSDQKVYKQHANININIDQHMNPKERCGRDIHGGTLFIQRAWEECVRRCEGRVVLVKCLDNCNFRRHYDTEGIDSDHADEKYYWNTFARNGAIVDLYSDPLGWDDDEEEEDDDDDGRGSVDGEINVKTIKGCSSKLQSIASAIEKAVQYIHQRSSDHKKDKDGDLQKPIPIIFDSITPILMTQGIEKLTILLTHIKQKHTMSVKVQASSSASSPSPIPSPIFLPCLIETLPLSSHRILEEYADALMTLQSGKLFMAKRSARAGGMVCGGLSGGMRLTKEVQLFDIDYNYECHRLDLWTKNSAGTTTSSSNKGDDSSKKNHQMTQNESAGAGAGAGGKKEVNKITTGTSNLTINDPKRTTPKSRHNNTSQSEQRRHQRPILEHQSDEQTRSVLTPPTKTDVHSHQPPRPKIYLEDNDPEFDDYDEEDPDDDLDI